YLLYIHLERVASHRRRFPRWVKTHPTDLHPPAGRAFSIPMPITALAYLLILIAAAYSYHGAPSQRRLPTRYAWDIAWRAAASGFLLLASQHGGYAIPITLAAYMAFLSIQPLLPQL
ncbi:hypothetical protein, partial [Segatella oris]|uniref:hypothetical protein n=1 Tax=Segatella oris TaxID=28135 RepID=UPI003607D5C7